ncbi:DUF968 domain-containing protein [Rosenbergiella epipactidis]|nr:DUF968 domain-containing protein [Rosenbergiella epipactidis]MBT0717798.1 DUF968 domain-containing protein [Rosenbergiella epipactidis]
MRLLLTPDVAPRSGTVILRPGREQLSMFTHGRIVVSPAPSALNFLPSGPLSDVEQDMMAGGDCQVQEEIQKQLVAFMVDPESPQSLMRKAKRLLWINDKYTRWVKAQRCVCCDQQADDPHHVIGYGLGGMATKAHDLFVFPLCRLHHNELHADLAKFENKYGHQLVLLFRFLDHAIAVGVIG